MRACKAISENGKAVDNDTSPMKRNGELTDLDTTLLRPLKPSEVYDSLDANPYSSCYLNVSTSTVVYALTIMALGWSGYV